MHLRLWHAGNSYKQGFRHLSDWTSSATSLLKFRSAVWLTLFVGSFQRCWAWDLQDRCQQLVGNTALPGWGTRGFISEFLDCISQDSDCQDMPVPCSELECNAEFDLTEWTEALIGDSVWPDSSDRMMLVSSVCPLTCKVCGPRKGDRQVKPPVAAILRGPCEHGWSYVDDSCFKYFYGGQDAGSRLDWFSAEDACQAEGAHLATVTTQAQKHLVFDLVEQHPAHLGRRGLWAWIGLWTQCSHNSSNWRWIGTPQLNISSSLLHPSFPSVCPPESTGSYQGVYTNSIDIGENYGFSSSNTSRSMSAWVCSKPALFHPVTGGQCQDVGLAPILDLGACEAAFKVLMGMDAPAMRIETANRPFGCHVKQVLFGPELNTLPGTQIVSAGSQGMLLCQSTNGTNQTAVDPDIGLTGQGQWEGVRTSEAPPSFSQPLLASLLAASFLPVLVVVAVRRRDLIVLKRHLRLLLKRFSTHMCKSEPDVTDPFFVVVARLKRMRRTIASTAAVAVGAYQLFELVRICFVEESVCTSASAHPQLRLFLALVHLGTLWVAGAFLALTHWIGQHSYRPELAFLLAVTVLDVVQTAIVGEQSLLVESRLYGQFLKRALLGASTSPFVALIGSILHLIGVGAVYKAMIPDGFIFTVGSTRAGLMYQQGCNQLWSRADALTGKELLLDMSRLSGVTDVSARHSLQALLDELLKKQTSFNNFLMAEILLVAIVMVCLLLLHTLMTSVITKGLSLQVSEDHLDAVSQVMENLCDATCQLSSDFYICCNVRKLNTILNMSPSGPCALEGTDFCSIIVGEDEPAGFKEFVQTGIREGFRGPYYVDLKGASSIPVRMQVLCAHFRDVFGQPCVLCGLTELQAGGRHGTGTVDTFGPLAPMQEAPGQAAPGQAAPRRSRRGSISSSSSSGGRSSGSSSGSGSSRGSGSQRRKEKIKKVEVHLDDNLTVVKTNEAFMEFLGLGDDSQNTAYLKPFLVEPEVGVELLRSCVKGVSSEDLGASSAQVINLVFNTGSQDHDFTPCPIVCRATPRKDPDSSNGVTLKLELLDRSRRRQSSQLSAASGNSGGSRGSRVSV